MRYICKSESITEVAVDCLMIPLAEYRRLAGSTLNSLNRASSGALDTMLESGEFSGKSNETAVLYSPQGFKAKRLLLIGLGEKKKLDAEAMRSAMGRVSTLKPLKQSSRAALGLHEYSDSKLAQAAAEGYLLGAFRMTDYKSGESQKVEGNLKEISFLTADRRSLERVNRAVGRGEIIAQGQILARQLTLSPPNDLTPARYAAQIQKLARKHGLKCTVLGEPEIRKEKMGALLSVAKGSVEPPRFVILEHKGKAGRRPVVLVGKGVTFDSGGLSLKSAASMVDMKQDMAGSAAVVATMVTAARLDLKVHVVAVMPITENMPSGTAVRPGDIITSRKGLTIEITNTDAEGRLILADALDYVNKFNPAAVIDIATLTGATKFIIGFEGAPVVGNNSGLIRQLERAAHATHERIWELPLWDEFGDLMKSSIADLHNSDSGRSAGTLTAAAFLKNFIGEYPWAHIDMACVDLEPKGRSYIPRGATGFGVRLFTEFLSDWKSL